MCATHQICPFTDILFMNHIFLCSHTDPRVQGWPLVANPLPLLALVALYLFIVLYGPKFMAKRKALNLKYVMMVYNVGLVVLSAYMCAEVGQSCILSKNLKLHAFKGRKKI